MNCTTVEIADARKKEHHPVQLRASGESGLYMSSVGLSLEGQFGYDQAFQKMHNLLDAALQNGITHFDLSPHYGPPYGAAEENFGHLAHALPCRREELVVSTRSGLGTQPGPLVGFGSRKRLLSSLNATLRRTGLEYIDVFYAHRHDPLTPIEETASALDAAVRQGKALYVGLSGYSPAIAGKVSDLLRDLGTPVAAFRVTYSMLNRWPEYGLLSLLEQEGFGCVVEGALDFKRNASTHLSEAEMDRFWERLSSVAAQRGQSSSQCALSWVLRKPVVTSVLITPCSVRELLKYCAAAGQTRFTDSDVSTIDRCIPDRELLW
ncbi:aldo/keto reductase [Streptoverticillium reticulum]|uniref:aldo/keto reductase n=1 Tax=Streptoverticillium reticulum TaxID=1433415 RepID=UPI0039BFC648